VIVATDGSQLSGTALLGGSKLAETPSAELHVLTPRQVRGLRRQPSHTGAGLLQDLTYKLVVRDLVTAAPSSALMIAEYAAGVGEEANVAVGTHGRGGRWKTMQPQCW